MRDSLSARRARGFLGYVTSVRPHVRKEVDIVRIQAHAGTDGAFLGRRGKYTTGQEIRATWKGRSVADGIRPVRSVRRDKAEERKRRQP